MRALIASTLSFGLLLGCVPQAQPQPSGPASPSATASEQGAVGAPCAPSIQASGAGTATVTELPHQIGTVALFGLDGSFVASAYSYPLGAQWQWRELDSDGTLIRQFEWRWQGAMLQSTDGTKAVYGVPTDSTSGRTALFVRDMNGPGRLLASINGTPLRWMDANRVLVEPYDEAGVIHSVDIRTGADLVVFSPPPPPTIKAAGDNDWFSVSGDLRWAVFMRWNAAGNLLRQDLFDLARQRYVPGVSLGTNAISLAPAGDIVLWLEGSQLRAMHLCDLRVVTVGSLTSSSSPVTVHWSADARFASFSFGTTTELTGPERIAFVDFRTGKSAEVNTPWGFVSQWSPDGRFVVLNRRGYHGPLSKLARFELN
jgi:hypothetical protein